MAHTQTRRREKAQKSRLARSRVVREDVRDETLLDYDIVNSLVRIQVLENEISSKLRFVWNESTMETIVQSITRQAIAINLLLTAFQSETISKTYGIMSSQKVKRSLKSVSGDVKSLQDARSAIATRATDLSTTGSFIGDEEFGFDDLVVNSTAYRRVFLKQQRRLDLRSIQENNSTHDGVVMDSVYGVGTGYTVHSRSGTATKMNEADDKLVSSVAGISKKLAPQRKENSRSLRRAWRAFIRKYGSDQAQASVSKSSTLSSSDRTTLPNMDTETQALSPIVEDGEIPDPVASGPDDISGEIKDKRREDDLIRKGFGAKWERSEQVMSDWGNASSMEESQHSTSQIKNSEVVLDSNVLETCSSQTNREYTAEPMIEDPRSTRTRKGDAVKILGPHTETRAARLLLPQARNIEDNIWHYVRETLGEDVKARSEWEHFMEVVVSHNRGMEGTSVLRLLEDALALAEASPECHPPLGEPSPLLKDNSKVHDEMMLTTGEIADFERRKKEIEPSHTSIYLQVENTKYECSNLEIYGKH